MPPSTIDSVPQRTQRSPGLAFLLSLALPGSGQIYTGKKLRGVATLILTLLAAAGFLALNTNSGLWSISLRALIVLYTFSFLDAYYSAREFNSVKAPAPFQNPRVAAVLNLLTNGFGYFYLGERAKGLIVFITMRLLGFALARVQWVWELINLGIAVDAYRIGRRDLQRGRRAPVASSSGLLTLGLSEEAAVEPLPEKQDAAPQGAERCTLSPLVPLSLAAILAVAYAGMVVIASIMPDYRVLDQSRAQVTATTEEWVYSNPRYGVEMHVSKTWLLDPSDRSFLIQAASADGICRAGLSLDSISPVLGLRSRKDALVEGMLSEDTNLRLLGQRAATLGVHAGYEVTFSHDLGDDQYLTRYVLARKGMTLYILLLTNRARYDDDCRRLTDVIRLRLVLPPE